MPQDSPIAAIAPEEVGVLIDDQKFRRYAGRQCKLPFRHDGFGGANDGDGRVSARGKFPIERFARTRRRIIRDAKDASIGARRGSRVTRHYVNFSGIGANPAECLDHLFENGS